MSQAQTIPAALPVRSRPLVSTAADVASVPWPIWCVVVGIFSAVVGGSWDAAWHMSIGRDSLWTTPHVMIWMEGVLVGLACVYTILTTTFGGPSLTHNASIRVLGLRAPGGVFIALWGSIAIVFAAPFDNWWHNAYGLDSTLVTLPHTVGGFGSLATKIGAIAWMASIINRSDEPIRRRLTTLLLIVGGVCVAQLAIMIILPTGTQYQHTARAYLTVALGIPAMMIATGWGSARRWGCTIAGAVALGLALASEWILPLFPAQPKLGPVYHNVTHLIPLRFPLLLIVPAFVTDLLLQRLGQRSSWKKALWIGPAFVLSLLAIQWPFANFLLSPASRNWVFGTDYFPYRDTAGVLYDPHIFFVLEKTRGQFVLTMVIAVVVAILTTRVGLAWGEWIRKVRR